MTILIASLFTIGTLGLIHSIALLYSLGKRITYDASDAVSIAEDEDSPYSSIVSRAAGFLVLIVAAVLILAVAS